MPMTLSSYVKNIKDLLKGIKILEKWSVKNGLKINKRKSGMLVMRSRKTKSGGVG